MLIAQISDLHVVEDDAAARVVDANRNLADCVAYLNGMARQPDVVLATGDLTDDGRPAQFEVLREILRDLRAPVLLIPGNHDEREPFRAAFRRDHAVIPADGPVHYALDDWPVRLVGLDSLRTGHHDGELDTPRLAWLDATLAARPDQPTLVFLHHPPFRTGIWWMDCIGLRGAPELREVIGGHPQVQRVVAGHIHRPIHTNWGDAVVSVAPSTTMQTQCDLHPEHRPVIAAETPMLQLHWYDGDHFVTHTTPFQAPAHRIEIADVVSDWEQAKARIKQGPPFPKGGLFG